MVQGRILFTARELKLCLRNEHVAKGAENLHVSTSHAGSGCMHGDVRESGWLVYFQYVLVTFHCLCIIFPLRLLTFKG